MLVGALTSAKLSESLDRWNWSNNIEFTAKAVESPATADELTAFIKKARGSIRVIGTAHSFSDIADTDGTHVTLEKFLDITVDPSAETVTFGAGTTYT